MGQLEPDIFALSTFRKANPLIRFVDGQKVEIAEDLGYRPWGCRGYPGDINVAAGTISDGNSRPWFAAWVLPRHSASTQLAGFIHDEMYSEDSEIVAAVKAGQITRKMADLIHRDCLVERGFSYFRASLAYIGLRLGGWIAWNKRNEAAGI